GNLHFEAVVAPAQRLVHLYKQLPTAVLGDLPDQQLQQIRDKANSDYSLFQQSLDFDQTKESNPGQVRNDRVQAVIQAYDGAFKCLHSWIAYSVQRVTDFRDLEDRARAAMQ